MGQQQLILDALLEVMAGHGIEGVSVRTVASAAGVSPAQVQYYFGTKERLLIAALDHVDARMQQRITAVDTAGPIKELLRRYLLTWLPVDGPRRADATVWFIFASAAVHTPQLQERVHRTDAAVVAALAELVAAGQAEGSVRPELEPTVTADLLLAAVDGLTMRALSAPDPSQVLPALDQLLDDLFTGPGNRDV